MGPEGTDRRRTLLMVTPYFVPEGGGLEAYVLRLSNSLTARHGWRIVVVTSGPSWGRTRVENVGDIRVYRLASQVRASNTRFGVTWRRELKRIIGVEQPDIINAHAPVPGLADLVAGLAHGIPFVVTYHAGDMRKGRWPIDVAIHAYERVFRRLLLARADWIMTSSEFVRDSFPATVRAKCSVVTPGVDTHAFVPGVAHGRNRVLFVGGLSRGDAHKGLDIVLAAVARVKAECPTVSLDVVGAGNDLPRYEELSRKLGLDRSVTFKGRLAGPDLLLAYQEASVLALPTRNDSFPMVLLEAMACGVPVVSTAVGGIPSIVDEGLNGLFVPPGDPIALAERLGWLLADEERARALGRSGREKVERTLAWDSQADIANKIFEAVLAGRPGDGRHRLAVVAPYFPPKIGGLENYAYQVARAFNDMDDFEVVVLTSNHLRKSTVLEQFEGLTVYRLRPWFVWSNTPINILWPWQLRRAMARHRIELVNVHMPVPFMAEAAALACGRRPLIVTYHAGSMMKERGFGDLVIKLYERWVLPLLFRRADAVIAVSPSVKSRFLGRFADKSLTIEPGVDVERFVLALDSGATRVPTILYVGQIARSSNWKGLDHLLEGFRLVIRDLPEAELVLVGGGDAVNWFQRSAAALGIADRVHFRGPLSGAFLVDAYQQATVIVLPSTTESESFGMSLIEAMACGKPVIGSNVGGIPFVISDGRDGLLVSPSDPQSLARACLRILRDPALASEFGNAGYRKVMSTYRWPMKIERYEALFRAVLDDRKKLVALLTANDAM